MLRTTIALLFLFALPLHEQTGDWPVYRGDAGGQGYSPLAEINRSNVQQLEVAWTWETGEKAVPGPRQPIPGQDVRPGSFEATPLVINDTMYLSTLCNRVVALDAATGEEILAAPLGNRSNANLMTYRTRAGHQFVVIAAGSGDDTRPLAFAVPETSTTSRGDH